MNDLDRLAGMIAGLEAHGLSVSEIGRRIKVSRCHAYRLAAGDVRRPSHDTFSKLEKLQAQVVKIAKPVASCTRVRVPMSYLRPRIDFKNVV